MGDGTRKRMIFTSIGVALLLVGITFVIDAWLSVSLTKAVSITQAMVTVMAIGVGGVWAFYKLEIFREFEPHLTITQEASHRKFGGNYVYVSVDVSLANSSKVAIRIKDASFWMQEVAPLENKHVEKLYRDFLDQPKTDKYITFPTLEKFDREWGSDEFVIEPGESSTDRYEFIIANRYDTVALGAFFADSTKKSRDPRIGWSAVTLHNINDIQESMS